MILRVKDLIQLLSEAPQDAVVVNYDNEYGKWWPSQRVGLTASGHVFVSEYDEFSNLDEEIEVVE